MVRSFVHRRAYGRVAPIPAVRVTEIEQQGFDPARVKIRTAGPRLMNLSWFSDVFGQYRLGGA